MQAIVSEKVPANEQGEMQGTLTSLISITSIIGPPLMTGVFSFYTNKNAPTNFAGAPFVLGAFLMALAVFVVIYNFKKREKSI